MPSVWLFKSSSPGPDAYEDHLRSQGFPNTSALPAITFSYVNEAALKGALERPNDFSGREGIE